jgi:hypothetical protein
MVKKVFLDLEETIINSWNDKLFLHHVDKIRKWLDKNEIKEIHIWSFAIWDESDKQHFVTSRLMEDIETALGRPIISYYSVEEMQTKVEYYEGMIYDCRTEFMQINGKRWSFIKYCLGSHKDCECILIDDAVPNQTLIDHDKNLTIQLINVLSTRI